jgi:SAM-dependent methyltransferase
MNEAIEETRLTDEGFWDHFWASLKVPSRVSSLSCLDRALSCAFLRLVPDGRGKTLIEIGAAPGRWLVFFHEKLGYAVDGVEYVPAACRKTEENLAVCGTNGRVFQQDFFRNDLPKHSYDVVLSLGFIEHFTDLDPVVAAHIALLKPGGHLVLGVPNLRGLHGVMERLTDSETLAAHNVEVMSVPFLTRLATEHELTPLWVGYTGGLNPGLLSVADAKAENNGGFAGELHRLRPGLVRFVLRGLSYIRNRVTLLDHLNGPNLSNYLLAIYRYTPRSQAKTDADLEHLTDTDPQP